MTLDERAELLRHSIAEDPESPTSRRFAIRRSESGLEFFAAQMTRIVDGEAEHHGYPTDHVPGKVLRHFRESGTITRPEYKKLVKRLG